jgi:hypothetical protein
MAFAASVSLRAELGHVCLYYGKPYITIDGYYYHKNRTGMKFAVLTTPMTADERASYQVIDGDHAYISRALDRERGELGRGVGVVTQEEMNEKSEKHPEHFAAPVLHDKPQRMAEKRAEWQLMKKMCPIGADDNEAKADAVEDKTDEAQAKRDAKDLFE